jgi:hypothetical protein
MISRVSRENGDGYNREAKVNTSSVASSRQRCEKIFEKGEVLIKIGYF